MKTLPITALLLLCFSISCKKEEKKICETYLVIDKVSISPASNITNGILFSVDAYGADLCYSFKELSIIKSGEKSYDIKVIGNVPCKPEVCAQAIYKTSPSGMISPVTTGTYTLRFFNGTALYSAVTVTI